MASKFTVKVKWGSETYPDIEIDSSEDPEVFKSQLFALTNVPPDRQKVLIAGKKLQDTWQGIRLKNKMTIMLTGSADPLPEKPVFTEEELAADAVMKDEPERIVFPSGLKNLGNTCYMNSVVHAFRHIPELEEAMIEKYATPQPNASPDALLATQIAQVFKQINTNDGVPVFPAILIQQLYNLFPDFGETSEKSPIPQQQDAEECFSRLLAVLNRCFGGDSDFEKSLIHQLLGIQMCVNYKCTETEQSTPVSTVESFFKLSCHIQKDTSFLFNGLRASLEEHISKYEETLGRDAIFEKKQSILRLPKFVTVQMVRFYWKPGVGKKPGNRAKVVKPIQFPEFLDLFDLCHDDLKAKLKLKRDYLEKMEEVKLGLLKEEPEKPESPFSKFDNDTGKYKLTAIITHQGYSAEGGHYTAWVRGSHGDKKEWLLFDDEKVSRHNYDTVKALERSTGDGAIPYLLIYSTLED
eukprot:CAMPEP_0201509476 /NCGR_PEP_ID=MMETSP0161_2-20130828/2515_1 /ASSEMBLY_ACC=CAM_ASM_000251 /TAXON_ID=180227 /ORGANISM="Neoparamoeba aestuarina, Strain SoJaBio B1-5/56/2" /LENGTH=465 /DNA_ID=CAMNT_0047904429 /DNA_START=113 /DNA_END=1510 /DNA_ORIENTATION=-